MTKLQPIRALSRQRLGQCTVQDCDEDAYREEHYTSYYCLMHLHRYIDRARRLVAST